MNHRNRLGIRRPAVTAVTALCLLLPATAWAEGLVKFKVVDSRSGKALPGATIVITAGPRELEDMEFKTAANGTVTTNNLDSGQRKYKAVAISVDGVGYKAVDGTITVIDNQTIEVEIKLDPLGEVVKVINKKLVRIDTTDPSIYTFRDRGQLQYFPNAIGNRQSLSKSLSSVPGVVRDSQSRMHVRGEADGTVLRLDGIQLPSFLSGRASQLLTPDVLENVRFRTGNLSPEYGSAGAVIDTTLRPSVGAPGNPLAPVHLEYAFGAEDFGGNSQSLTVSHQINALRPGKNGTYEPNPDSRAGYLLNFSRRQTDNLLESPQPQRQLSNNGGVSELLTGKFTYRLSPASEASAFLMTSGGRTGIANRQGLPDSYINRGQGYGFGGNLNRTDLPPVFIGDANAGNLKAYGASQELTGNQVSQSDNNQFYGLQLSRKFNAALSGKVSLAGSTTRQDTTNRNPRPATVLPVNHSIEYNQTTGLGFDQSQVQADFEYSKGGSHNYKFGFLTQSLDGSESYLFQPQSQTALAAMQTINGFIGNNLRPDSANNTPTMLVGRTGGYSAFYVQDYFVPTERLRFNLGLRVENYEQTQNIRFVSADPRATFNGKRSQSATSPRINVLYNFPDTGMRLGPLKLGGTLPTTLRVGFNRLFTPPGIGQGAVGTNQTGANPLPVAAQTADQVDLSLEQQLRNQVVRLSTYSKDIDNTHAWQQMIPGPQSGAYMMVNQGKSKVTGYEALYELKPHSLNPRIGDSQEEQPGVSGYIAYANSTAKFKGTNASLAHDQQQTLNAGLGYQVPNGGSFALAYTYGSGLQSSIVSAGGTHSPINQLDLRFRSRPKFINSLHTLEVGFENLTNERNLFSFNQGAGASAANSFNGTRFQQGRRVVVTLSGKF